MIKNYLKVFFRNVLKNPGYSTINILGLAVGLASSIVAFLFILNETSYNKGFKDHEKIYRITIPIEGAGLILISTELEADVNEIVEKILKIKNKFS